MISLLPRIYKGNLLDLNDHNRTIIEEAELYELPILPDREVDLILNVVENEMSMEELNQVTKILSQFFKIPLSKFKKESLKEHLKAIQKCLYEDFLNRERDSNEFNTLADKKVLREIHGFSDETLDALIRQKRAFLNDNITENEALLIIFEEHSIQYNSNYFFFFFISIY